MVDEEPRHGCPRISPRGCHFCSVSVLENSKCSVVWLLEGREVGKLELGFKPLISDRIAGPFRGARASTGGNHCQGCAERVNHFLPLLKSSRKKQKAVVVCGEGWKRRGEELGRPPKSGWALGRCLGRVLAWPSPQIGAHRGCARDGKVPWGGHHWCWHFRTLSPSVRLSETGSWSFPSCQDAELQFVPFRWKKCSLVTVLPPTKSPWREGATPEGRMMESVLLCCTVIS